MPTRINQDQLARLVDHPNIAPAAQLLGISQEELRSRLSAHGTPATETSDAVIKRYLSVTEAGTYSGLGRWTLGRKARSGELPVIKLSPAKSGKVLIDIKDIDRMLSKLKSRASSQSEVGKQGHDTQ